MEIAAFKRYTAKYSDEKSTIPGAKQIFRDVARDVWRAPESRGVAEALLRPVSWRPVVNAARLEQARERARESGPGFRRAAPTGNRRPWPVIYSRELRALMEQTRANLMGTAPES